MLNDVFIEEIVRHKKTGKDYGVIAAAVVVTLFLMAAVLLLPTITPFFFLFFWGVILYGTVNVIRSRNVEFEYILTNSELDIDRIIAKNYRKHMASIDLKEIEVLAPVSSPDHQDEFLNKNGLAKVYDFTGNHQTPLYFLDYVREQRKQRIIFQPRRSTVEAAKKFNPRHIFTE